MKGLCAVVLICGKKPGQFYVSCCNNKKTLVSRLHKKHCGILFEYYILYLWLAQNFGSVMAKLFHVNTTERKQENEIYSVSQIVDFFSEQPCSKLDNGQPVSYMTGSLHLIPYMVHFIKNKFLRTECNQQRCYMIGFDYTSPLYSLLKGAVHRPLFVLVEFSRVISTRHECRTDRFCSER